MLMQVHQASLRVGSRQLGRFNLQLRAGDRIAILGPSGAGKSSLLKLLAKELPASQGSVSLGGRDLQHWSAPELARRRAVLPQAHGLAFALPVELVVSLGRVAREVDPTQMALVRQALAQAHASHLWGRRFDTLSGGEQARVQLARVFAQLWDAEGGVLLVDEPLAALDPGLVLELMHAMREFAAERGHALVAVLHDMSLAMNHFERLWLLKDGQILADCEAVPAVLPLLEQLYGLRLRLLQDAEGMALLASRSGNIAARRVAEAA